MKRALITGVTGQDGSYLAEFLLEKGYEVHGIKRRASSFNTQRVDHIYEDPHTDNARFKLHYGDLTDSSNLTRILSEVEPDEVYNLGAQSHERQIHCRGHLGNLRRLARSVGTLGTHRADAGQHGGGGEPAFGLDLPDGHRIRRGLGLGGGGAAECG